MCGRYTDTRRDKQLLVRLGVANAAQAEMHFVPRYNLAPTQEASIVVRGADGPELRRGRFGMIPFWAKDQRSMFVNLRDDTLATKPAFRKSFQKRRCLVLADGFYEWQKLGKFKQPIYIRMNGGGPFVFGALWDRWNDVDSFSIVTVPPNELLAPIHDRMPLVVKEEDASRWLDKETPLDEAAAMLKPYPAVKMQCHTVRPLVNNAQVDSPECIAPLDPAPRPLAQTELGI
jgi:putative SOS response-associated peptidase YedK